MYLTINEYSVLYAKDKMDVRNIIEDFFFITDV